MNHSDEEGQSTRKSKQVWKEDVEKIIEEI